MPTITTSREPLYFDNLREVHGMPPRHNNVHIFSEPFATIDHVPVTFTHPFTIDDDISDWSPDLAGGMTIDELLGMHDDFTPPKRTRNES